MINLKCVQAAKCSAARCHIHVDCKILSHSVTKITFKCLSHRSCFPGKEWWQSRFLPCQFCAEGPARRESLARHTGRSWQSRARTHGRERIPGSQNHHAVLVGWTYLVDFILWCVFSPSKYVNLWVPCLKGFRVWTQSAAFFKNSVEV